MKLAYVCGPYRSKTVRGIVENIRAAESVALELWNMGFAVICPHKNSALFDGAAPDSVWLNGDLEILSRCDLLVTCTGWWNSDGSMKEVAAAGVNGIPVYHWPGDKKALEGVAKSKESA